MSIISLHGRSPKRRKGQVCLPSFPTGRPRDTVECLSGRVWCALQSNRLRGKPVGKADGKAQREEIFTSPRRFLVQSKGECRFSNTTGQEQVRFLQWYIYDRMEFLLFDSAVGRFMAVMLLGEPIATDWNKKVLQDRRAGVDRCRYNFHAAVAGRMVGRRVQPEVTISPTKDDPLSPRSLLLCTTASFYPGEIEVRWLKNGRRATEGVFYGEELHNGDWTYQTQVMLEDTPQRGDVYACQVEHASLQTPITVQWEPRTSTSARIKLWTGVVGALLGMVFVAMGLSCYLRSKKGSWGHRGIQEGGVPSCTALLSPQRPEGL
uniref:Ig-like domain-containing protein n=1 Tax=Varanus komodoensis TaxID=61221 RepID=A0A8D2L937_VARKO